MNTQIVKTEKAGRKRYLESDRRELVRKYGRSGMTQAAFCRANGLGISGRPDYMPRSSAGRVCCAVYPAKTRDAHQKIAWFEASA